MRTALLPVAACVLAIAGCASSSPDVSFGPDAGIASSDASKADDPDETEVGCAPGTHTCGSTCVPDVANAPAVGCRYGCGEACPTETGGVATCTSVGTCDIECKPGYGKVNGACVPFGCTDLGYACGDYTDQDGTTFSCGSCYGSTTCGSDHLCNVPKDAQELNNTRSAAKDLGTFNDADNRSHQVSSLTIDSATDEDWFKFRVTDGFDANNPDARVDLSLPGTLGWLSSSFELTVWFKCDSADDGTQVKCGEWYATSATNNANSSTLGKGCTVNARYVVWARFETHCSGTNDSGTAYVRVRKRALPKGDKYNLGVEVK